jgi:hypothetical protein
MTDTQTTEASNTNSTESKVLTAEERASGIAKLDGMALKAVVEITELIDGHNADVKLIRDFSADAKDEKLVISEIIERNPGNDKFLEKVGLEIKKIEAEIEKKKDEIEKLLTKAWDVAKKYEPEATSVEDVQKIYDNTATTVAKIRAAKEALEFFSKFAGTDLSQLLPEAETTRGLRRPGDVAAGQKPSYKKMIILKKDEKNEDGTPVREEIYKAVEKDGKKTQVVNTTTLANTLSSRAGRGVKITSSEITTQFLASRGTTDFSKLTAGVEYPFTFTKEIKNSDGKVIETKSWDLIFVK